MPVPRLSRKPSSEGLRATERWFVRHGLPYFVPAERAAARSALHPRRTVPLLAAAGLGAVTVAVTLAWLFDDLAFAPATLITIGLLAAAAYAVTALRARPILTWALSRTVGSIRQLLPMVTRALPLLLIFVTFLFINAEVWQVAANLDGGVMWLTVLLFAALGVGFFVARLPEEVDRVDDELDSERIAAICAGTPMADDAARLARTSDSELTDEVRVTGFERANLMLALLITQATQVLILSASVFGFFLVFGAITMQESVVTTWIGEDSTHSIDAVSTVSVELLQVSLFLAAFSGLYFTVYAVTDETYRDQFFVSIRTELEKALAMRAAYALVRRERGEETPGEAGPRDASGTPASPNSAVSPVEVEDPPTLKMRTQRDRRD